MTKNEAQRLADKIGRGLNKDKANLAQTINDLKELRNYFIEIKDPMVTKVLRLAYEHLENHGNFEIEIEDFDPEAGQSVFEYLMELVGNYDNKYNREELQEFKQKLLN